MRLKLGEGADYAVGPPHPIHVCVTMFFKNFLSVRRQCDGALSCMINK